MVIRKRHFLGMMIAGICRGQAKSEDSLGSYQTYSILHPSISENERSWIDMTLRSLDLCGLQFSKIGLPKSKLPAVVLRLIIIDWPKGTTEILLLDAPSLAANSRARKSVTKQYSGGDVSTSTTKSKIFSLGNDTLAELQKVLQKLERKPSGVEIGFEMNQNKDNTLILEILLPESFKVFMMDDYKSLQSMRDIVSTVQKICLIN